jgi:hypothetical protein
MIGPSEEWRLDMKGAVLIGVAALALLPAVGCSSLAIVRDLHEQRFTSEEHPVAHLSARVGGIYLFYYLPLVTGDSERADSIRFFRNEPDVDRVVHMVTRKSKELGATHLTDLYSWSDSVWASFSLIFWYRWTSVSANASMAPQTPAPSSTPH